MANLNVNKVILGGRLTAEPELKTTQSGKSVCSFSIAVNRKIKQQGQPNADFFNVVAWSNNADTVARYFHKGSSICIVGSLQNSSWKDKNGQTHYKTDIVADEVNFVDSKSDDSQSSYGQQTAPKFEEIKTDDNLPF